MVQDDRPAGLDGVQVKFDDERVVCDAGVMLVAALQYSCQIDQLIPSVARPLEPFVAASYGRGEVAMIR